MNLEPNTQNLPQTIPVFPLAGALLLPRAQLPLNIFEPRYLAMIDDALAKPRVIGMIQPDETKASLPAEPILYPTGCAGRISQFAETGDGRYLVTLTGIARFKVVEERRPIGSAVWILLPMSAICCRTTALTRSTAKHF
jgi:Lon protease-like protein